MKEAAGLRESCPHGQEAGEPGPGWSWAVSKRNCLSPPCPGGTSTSRCMQLPQAGAALSRGRGGGGAGLMCRGVGKGRSHFPRAQERGALGYGMQAGAVEPEVPAVQRLGTGHGPCEPRCCPFLHQKNLITHTPLAFGNFYS